MLFLAPLRVAFLAPLRVAFLAPLRVDDARILVALAGFAISSLACGNKVEADPAPPASAEFAGPRRLSVSGARAERTRALRGKDPALDSAMDALDLELLE